MADQFAEFETFSGDREEGTAGAYLLAEQQLLRRGHPVARVAAELGYTGSSFSRVFAQRVGSSPRTWLAASMTG